MSVINPLDFVLDLPTLLETNDLLIKPKFLLPVGKDTGADAVPNEVVPIPQVNEVVIDGGGVDVPGLGAR